MQQSTVRSGWGRAKSSHLPQTSMKIPTKSGWGNGNVAKFTYQSKTEEPKINQLQYVEYHPNFIANPNILYKKFLTEFNFEDRMAYLDSGKSYLLNRATCVFGDSNILDVPPKIWGADNPINPWTDEMLEIKNKIEALTDRKYNVCLCNYYKDGTKTIGWHNDKEERGSVASIASISLGAKRLFQLKEIEDNTKIYDCHLENGSLFLMKNGCQDKYLHWLPPDPSCFEGRINLTFRLFDIDRYAKS